MSGRTKLIIYRIFEAACIVAEFVAAAFLFYAANGASWQEPSLQIVVIADSALAVCIFFPIGVLVHELGHLLFGFLSGMKFFSVCVNGIGIYRTGKPIRFVWRRDSGATQMFPNNGNVARGRILTYTLGGIFSNFIYGAIFLVLFFAGLRSPVLLFFEVLAPFSLAEGLIALYPAELPAGKTDGAFALSILKKMPEADIALRVFRAQGILNHHCFSEIPRNLLFDAPVVREDDNAFLALEQLRYQYMIWHGDTEGAIRELKRLTDLHEYLSEEQNAEIAYDWVFVRAVLCNENVQKIESSHKKDQTIRYYRAVAATENGEIREEALEKAGGLIKKLPLRGIQEYEKKLLFLLQEKRT